MINMSQFRARDFLLNDARIEEVKLITIKSIHYLRYTVWENNPNEVMKIMYSKLVNLVALMDILC